MRPEAVNFNAQRSVTLDTFKACKGLTMLQANSFSAQPVRHKPFYRKTPGRCKTNDAAE
jgi:hypothetical protein